MESLLAWVRALRRRAAGWSIADDRRFHDALFADLPHDPFSPSYPGSVTIRRFADHADPHIASSKTVLDLGCGPAEITCELARRHPQVQFHGVDHSSAAIAQARALASRLGLANVTFEAGDAGRYVPPARVGLITMFDAFHHLLAPREFVRSLSASTDRFLLIEPAGDALGRWRRTLDFDWVASELDKVRMRMEHQLGRTVRSAGAAGKEVDVGRAVENRYAASDYESIFEGFALTFSGTAAGLDVYPPDPYTATPWRPRFVEITYGLFCALDEEMRREGIDLHAKHWVISADRHAPPHAAASLASAPRVDAPPSESIVSGAWDGAVTDLEVPSEVAPATEIILPLTITNRSWRAWTSGGDTPINVSYHWLDRRRTPVDYDGLRTPLPRVLEPNASVRGTVRVRTPPNAGAYILQIDLVEEGVTWFSRAGVPPCEAAIRVRP